MRGHQIEVVDDAQKDRVGHAFGAGLQAQTFGERAGEEACGFNALEAGEEFIDLCHGCAGVGCDLGQGLAQPTGRFECLSQGEGDAGLGRGQGLAGDPVGDMGHQAWRGGFGAAGWGIIAAEHAVPAGKPVTGGRRAELEGGVFGCLFFEIAGQAGGIGLEQAQRGLQRHGEVQALGGGDFDPLVGGHVVYYGGRLGGATALRRATMRGKEVRVAPLAFQGGGG